MQNATRRWRFVVRSWWVMQGLNLRPLPCEGYTCDEPTTKVSQPKRKSYGTHVDAADPSEESNLTQ
jgi:hypothetical protein